MFKWKSETTALDAEIDDVTGQLNHVLAADSDEYETILGRLERLHKLKAMNKPERVSRDTLAMIAGNLVTTAVIMQHERAHVITTKAWSFVQKLR